MTVLRSKEAENWKLEFETTLSRVIERLLQEALARAGHVGDARSAASLLKYFLNCTLHVVHDVKYGTLCVFS